MTYIQRLRYRIPRSQEPDDSSSTRPARRGLKEFDEKPPKEAYLKI